jgi:hypothetical protein
VINAAAVWREPALEKPGFSPDEGSGQLDRLDAAVFACYKALMAETTSSLEQQRQELRQAQLEFKHTQRVFGEVTETLSADPCTVSGSRSRRSLRRGLR